MILSENPGPPANCKNATVSVITFIPKLETDVITNYEDISGEWISNYNNLEYNLIPSGGILSMEFEMFGRKLRLGERSCEIANDVTAKTQSRIDQDMDRFEFSINTSIQVTE